MITHDCLNFKYALFGQSIICHDSKGNIILFSLILKLKNYKKLKYVTLLESEASGQNKTKPNFLTNLFLFGKARIWGGGCTPVRQDNEFLGGNKTPPNCSKWNET